MRAIFSFRMVIAPHLARTQLVTSVRRHGGTLHSG
jgi:hypothetical protein